MGGVVGRIDFLLINDKSIVSLCFVRNMLFMRECRGIKRTKKECTFCASMLKSNKFNLIFLFVSNIRAWIKSIEQKLECGPTKQFNSVDYNNKGNQQDEKYRYKGS